MPAQVTFKPLYGVLDENPMCYLLKIDQVTILLDCGWNETFDVSLLEPLRDVASSVDLVLVSFPDLQHIGALPYAFKMLGLKAPIYATGPTYEMGSIFLSDVCQSKSREHDFNLFNLEDVEAVCINFGKRLQYLEHLQIQDNKDSGIFITPLNAGHMLGGAIWRIRRQTEDILYAVDINHARERHLNACSFAGIERPTLLITDSYHAGRPRAPKNATQDIIQTAIAALRKYTSVNVLIPVDSAGRAFELLFSFDRYWTERPGLADSYKLVFLNRYADRIISRVRGQLEWMSDEISKRFDRDRKNPFDFSTIIPCKTMKKANSIPGSKIVFTSSDSLEGGFSKELLLQWGGDVRNLLILTSDSYAGSLSRRIWDDCTRRGGGGESKVISNSSYWSIPVHKRVPLEGAELASYMASRTIPVVEVEAGEEAMEVDASDDEDEFAGLTGLGRYKTPRYLMFGYKEDDLGKSDAYGVYLREGEIRPAIASGYLAAEVHAGPAGLDSGLKQGVSDAADDDVEDDVSTVPTKVLTETIEFELKCQRYCCDLGGRSDMVSVRNILEKLLPRQLVLVHGSAEATSSMQAYLSDKGVCERLHVAEAGVELDVSGNMSEFPAKLLNHRILDDHAHAFGEYTIGFFDVKVEAEEVVVVDREGRSVVIEHDTLLRCDTTYAMEPREAVLLGLDKMKLSDVQGLLTKAGIASGFVDQALVCEGDVVVRRAVASGEVMVEGPVSDMFFTVRDIVYRNFVLV